MAVVVDRGRVVAALPTYDVGAQLGAGAFGLVLEGHHRDLGRDVAIKVLSTAPAEGVAGEFRSEARVLAGLRHPHIVDIYDYVERVDLGLIIMELLPGGTLTERRRAGALSPEGACAVGLAVADAMTFAHERGVLHRDIKPDNMLFTADDLVKVTDFGIAKIFEGTAVTASAAVGTPKYMAPEQIGKGRLGPATDLYAVGLILYETLAGMPPFDPSLSVWELYHHQIDVMPPAPPGVPDPLADVIMRTLAKDPADRYRTARAFALDLAGAAGQAYGPRWTARSGIVLRIADEVRDAAEPRRSPTVPSPRRPDPVIVRERPTDLSVAPERSSDGSALYTGRLRAGDPPDRPVNVSRTRKTGPWKLAIPVVVLLVAGIVCATLTLTNEPRSSAAASTARPKATTTPASGVITTVIGNGQEGRPPTRNSDGQQATRVAVETSGAGIAIDKNDSIYIAGPLGIQKVDPKGRISTVVSYSDPAVADVGGSDPNEFLWNDTAIAVDGSGNVYVTNTYYNIVLRIDSHGFVRTIAGSVVASDQLSGEGSFAGDGGVATRARLNHPTGVAVDRAGNVFIADSGNNRIRKVNTSGDISTVAGTGDPGVSGDGQAAVRARLYAPQGVAVGIGGDLYIADGVNKRVRRVDSSGRISTIVDGSSGGMLPLGIAVDPHGDVYIADGSGNVLRHLDAQGRITTVAGTGVQGFSGDHGPASRAELNDPVAVALDGHGNIYVVDSLNLRVRRISALR